MFSKTIVTNEHHFLNAIVRSKKLTQSHDFTTTNKAIKVCTARGVLSHLVTDFKGYGSAKMLTYVLVLGLIPAAVYCYTKIRRH